MSWINHWKTIGKRIDGISALSTPYFEAASASGSDYYGIGSNYVIVSAREIAEEIIKLKVYELPSEILNAISRFERIFKKDFSGLSGTGAAIIALGIIKSEIDFFITDHEIATKERAELAFKHLQRSIVVDKTIRKKWTDAYKVSEPELEKLGSIHLLYHNLWGFKVHGEGERTDLVLSEPIHTNQVTSSGSTLLLTEWKKAQSESDIERKTKEALSQTKRYKAGVLGASELKKTVYLIIVTLSKVDFETTYTENGIDYRRLVLAVNPPSPSKS